jgi:hypothetical protein
MPTDDHVRTTMTNLRYSMLAGLATLALVAGLAGRARADAVCGDLDGNGALTRADCDLILDVVAGPPDAPGVCRGAAAGATQCGDLNADGGVDGTDAVLCRQVVGGGEPSVPLCGGSGGGPSAPIACPGGTATIANDVTRSQTWPATCTIVLDGTIFVNGNLTLTIEPGTVVQGKKNSTDGTPSALIFRRGAKINAAGTAEQPIVFTSDQAAGSRARGDWGGLMLNGRAPVNVPGGEGLAEGLSGVPFGGTVATDSSGILKYVRVEYAGRELSVDNELNLVTFNAVGSGTMVDHVQAHVGFDDGLEWFGGTVNGKFLVATGCGDDCLDWQLGATGLVQYALAAQYLPNVEAGGSNGIEADNNENGFNLLPRSAMKFCNLTLLGTNGQPGTRPAVNMIGMLFRRGTGATIANAVVAGFGKVGMELRDNATSAVGCNPGKTLTGNLVVQSSIFFNNGSPAAPAEGPFTGGNVHCGQSSGTDTPCNGCELYDLWANGTGVVPDLCAAGALGCQDQTPVVDPLVSLAWPPTDPRPAAGSPAASGAANCSTLDPFFETTTYIGAFEPGGTNWLETPGGWINFAVN